VPYATYLDWFELDHSSMDSANFAKNLECNIKEFKLVKKNANGVYEELDNSNDDAEVKLGGTPQDLLVNTKRDYSSTIYLQAITRGN
jgi:hypothetical protein